MRLSPYAALAILLGLGSGLGWAPSPAMAIDLSPESRNGDVVTDDDADDTPDPEVIVSGVVTEVGRDGMFVVSDVTGSVNVMIPGPPQGIKVGDRLTVRGETDDTQPVPVLVAQEVRIGQGPTIQTSPSQ